MEIGDVIGAEECFKKALQLFPDFTEAYVNLGLMLDKRNDKKAAEACYLRAIELNPTCSETHLNLGILLANEKRFNEAEAAYKQAIDLKPHSPIAWSNLGVLYACINRDVEAERCYRTSMFLDEYYVNARFNMSYLLLRQGRLEEGWLYLEARNWYVSLANHFTCPRWHGEVLTDKSILIGYEAGHGDMIQFCRYVTVLKDMGAASITMICHPPLKTLFKSLEGVDSIISFDEPIPSAGWDFWTPLLSIPYYCKTRIDSIPAEIPYLHATTSCIEKWAHLLPKDGLCVGLVWKGNPLFENDADRSITSLDVLAPLWSVVGVNFVSLQKGSGENEVMQLPAGRSIINIGPQLRSFADTAAVVASLDLIICVDTAIAHLTCALGKPCWVLLPKYKTDWRWLKDRTDSPWYPEIMRLFRQTLIGDWASVVADVVTSLEKFSTNKMS